MLGLTQIDLARAIGVQPQQVQKYECGSNQVYASRLFDIARALGTPVSYFYEGLAGIPNPLPPNEPADEIMNRSETAALIHALVALSPRARSALATLAVDLAADAEIDAETEDLKEIIGR